MALPFIPYLKNRYYSVATTSTSGAPISTVVVASRCKYLSGWYAPNNIAGTGTNVTGFDVLAFIGGGVTGTVISSGTSVTTSTGTGSSPINVTATSAVFLNPGDIIQTLASTGVGGFVTHVVGEF